MGTPGLGVLVQSQDPGLVVAEIGPVCLALWRSTVTRERFEAQRRGLERVVRAHPGEAGFLCLIEPTSPVPSVELQRASASLIAIHRPRLKFVACVIEGDGLRAFVVRRVLNGMRALVTGRVNYGFYPTVAVAAIELARVFPACGLPEAIEQGVESARALMGPAS
jgi:hypothetical protein